MTKTILIHSSHDGPIGSRRCGNILTMDQSDAGGAGIFSRLTNRTRRGVENTLSDRSTKNAKASTVTIVERCK
eukprot:84858-Prorocentrum_minimum.AAC.1